MLDHVFLTVADPDASIAFYTSALAPLGITTRLDYDGKDGPPGHPDLYGLGDADTGRMIFWLRRGAADGRAAHIGFVADSPGRGGRCLRRRHRRGCDRQRGAGRTAAL